MSKPSQIPSFSAEWPDNGGTTGVHAGADGITWWTNPGGPNGRYGEMASTQDFDDFLRNGPAVPGASAQVLADLEAAVRACGYKG